MTEWTKQQKNAIDAVNRELLVSAAAGSGKTAVLVERIIRKITDSNNPVDIDRLLIVTFTNAAAAEMRFRISKSLKEILKNDPENENARRQLSLIPNAKISTIDSFCINVSREKFYELGINRDFSILDDNELQIFQDSIISDVCDEYFEKNDELFIALTEQFDSPGKEGCLAEMIKKTLEFIYAQPFPYVWCKNVLKYYDKSVPFEKSVWYEYISSELKYLLRIAYDAVTKNRRLVEGVDDVNLSEKFFEMINSDLELVNQFINAADASIEEILNLPESEFARMPSTAKLDTRLAAQIKSCRNVYKKIIKTELPSLIICNKEEYEYQLEALYPLIQKLIEVTKRVDELLLEQKTERGAYTFSDIEHFVINLLFKYENGEVKKTAFANEMSAEFEEILVDEYQDTNEAQDLLFSYLSNGRNLFAVGDVKQSIYRFRLAMPSIFNKKRKEYREYDGNDYELQSKIILDKNFRSSKGICDYVNFVFTNCMSERVGELDYGEEDSLNCGALYKENEIPAAQIKIIDGNSTDVDKNEAYQIARLIRKKIDSKEQIKDGASYRDITYGDFAVLFRSLKNHFQEYVEAFTDMAIPVICDNSSNLFDNNEIKIIMSLLRTVNNPTVDIELLSTMMSAVYGFTADELAQIRIDNPHKSFYHSVASSQNEKVIAFLYDIKRLKRLSVTMSVSSFIRYIIEEKGIVAFANAMGNGEQRYQNILSLINFAKQFDSGINVGLTSFIRYIDKIIASDANIESKPVGAGGNNYVTLMTIHHSKGLEFPVCILAGSSRAFNMSDLQGKMLLNTDYGFGLKVHNEEYMYDVQSLPYSVIKSKNKREMMSENLRVLYVAMTRAKEQFITFYSCKSVESTIKNLSDKLINGNIEPYSVQSITSDGALLLLCALIHPDGELLRELIDSDIRCEDADFRLDIEIIDVDSDNDENEIAESAQPDEEITAAIRDKLSYVYERSELSTVASKLTASSLDDFDNGLEYIAESKPAFMSKSEMTPAERGSAMHLFMQYCDYNGAKNDLSTEIQCLTDGGFITQKQAYSLEKDKLSLFFNGAFAKRMFGSEKIYREIKLSSYVKASELYETKLNDKILVHGVADCVFVEKDGLVLVDYKTDRVKNEAELLERYKKQIAFYKYALEKTFEKPVKEAVLYSFYLGKACKYK